MCEHCEKMSEVLTELTGAKVAGVIMRRVGARLHPLDDNLASPKLLIVTT
jgi:hypothetical protein